MKRFLFALFATFLCAGPIAAQNYYEPARGSQERRDILDAIRPEVEWQLGVDTVEFVVHDLRVYDGLVYFSLTPQHPGGGEIKPRADQYFDNVGVTGFGARWRGYWWSMDVVVGATDVWFYDSPYCRWYAQVIPEYCPR